MAVDRRQGSKIIKNLRRGDTPGLQIDPHPYVGIVKNNLDSIKAGRLQVWIPDLGGDENEPRNWRTVSYASPYMGYTPVTGMSDANSWTNVQHTYGMWMVPPDIGVEVLCIFVAGDPLRGFWFACVNSNLSRYMLPGLASSSLVDATNASAVVKKNLLTDTRYPVTEFNERGKDFDKNKQATFTRIPKPIHETQFNILREQGLDRDPFRGTVTSSSQRESPSNVFGISSPGRPLNDPADNEEFINKLRTQSNITEEDYAVKNRKGGHSFIMDDGDLLGNDNLLRLRTAGGHQLMMNDSGNTLYLANAQGTVWLEFDSQGRTLLYSSNGVAIRTAGTLDIRADRDINIDAGRNIKIRADQKLSVNAGSMDLLTAGGIELGTGQAFNMRVGGQLAVDATGKISLLSRGDLTLNAAYIGQNSGGGILVTPPKPLANNNLVDTSRSSEQGLWTQNSQLDTICTVAPSHEPYNRPLRSRVEFDIVPALPEKFSGIDATKTTPPGVTNPVTEFDLRNQPKSDCVIGNLSKEQVTALFAQIGKSESGGNYKAVNTIGYIGKYQWGYQALIDNGLVKSHVRRNSQLNDPNSWTGKGCSSLDEFLNNPELQEQLICEYTKRNYNTLVRIKALSQEDSPETVAGMLMCAHLLGPGGAKNYRIGGNSGADAYGTTAESYYNKGKYAVANSNALLA